MTALIPPFLASATTIKANPIVRKKRTVIKEQHLCEGLSVSIRKCRRLKKDKHSGKTYVYEKHYYIFDDLTHTGLTLAQVREIYMRLGQFLEGEKQPAWL